MHLYPIMLNLKDKTVVVIGGGNVASRKVEDLVNTGAIINIVSPVFNDRIDELAKINPNTIKLIKRNYRKEDLHGSSLVFSTSSDPETNKKIYEHCVVKNILLNAADDPGNCSFYIPSCFKKDDLIVAVSTTGASPAFASKLRKDIESSIPDDISLKLAALKEARMILKNDSEFSDYESSMRGNLLKKITSNDALLNKLVQKYQNNGAKEFLISIAATDKFL